MQNIEIVKPLESQRHMYECPPNSLLIKAGIVLLVCHNFLVEVTIVEELHYYAEYGEMYQRELASMKECL